MKALIAGMVAALAASAAAGHDTRHHAATAARPPVTGPADAWVYPLAAPGTYRLPAIRPAADARLSDETGAEVSLAAMMAGRITVLAFIYTRCGDICPLASSRMADLRALLAEDPALARGVTLASLSFDPAHDTPAVLARYAEAFRDPEVEAPDWRFLTAASEEAIAPVLDDWRQPVSAKADPADPSGPMSHLLRVFLVDAEGMVRNIYSADFLDPRLVLNDIRTLRIDAVAD